MNNPKNRWARGLVAGLASTALVFGVVAVANADDMLAADPAAATEITEAPASEVIEAAAAPEEEVPVVETEAESAPPPEITEAPAPEVIEEAPATETAPAPVAEDVSEAAAPAPAEVATTEAAQAATEQTNVSEASAPEATAPVATAEAEEIVIYLAPPVRTGNTLDFSRTGGDFPVVWFEYWEEHPEVGLRDLPSVYTLSPGERLCVAPYFPPGVTFPNADDVSGCYDYKVEPTQEPTPTPTTEPTQEPTASCVPLTWQNVKQYGTLKWSATAATITLREVEGGYCNDITWVQVRHGFNTPAGVFVFSQTVLEIGQARVGKSGLVGTASASPTTCGQVDAYQDGTGIRVGDVLEGAGLNHEAVYPFLSQAFPGSAPSYALFRNCEPQPVDEITFEWTGGQPSCETPTVTQQQWVNTTHFTWVMGEWKGTTTTTEGDEPREVSLTDEELAACEQTPTPTPTPEPTVEPTPEPTDTPSATPSETPSATATASAAPVVTSSPSTPAAKAEVNNDDTLASTGASVGWVVGLAILLVAGGCIVLMVRRRATQV